MQSNRYCYLGATSFAFISAASALVAMGCTDIPTSSGSSGTSSSSTGAGGGGSASTSSGGGGGVGGNGGIGGSGGAIPFAGGILVQGIVGLYPNWTNALFRFSLDGTWSRKLANIAGSDVHLSTNRSRLVAWSDQDTLIFMDPAGENVALLDIPMLQNWSTITPTMTISPSGRYATYLIDTVEPTRSLYIAATDGSPSKVLFTGQDIFCAWSPKEDKLVYGGINIPLRMYDLDADAINNVTNSLLTKNTVYEVSWSHDGERLAFTEDVPNDLVLVSVDKQLQDRRVLLTNLESGGPREHFTWSPDDQYLSLEQYLFNGGVVQQWLVDAAGTMTFNVVEKNGTLWLGWTPTNHFVYAKADNSIYSMTISGTILELLAPHYPSGYYRGLGPNGRVLYVDGDPVLKAIGADGSNPITYANTVFPESRQFSNIGPMIAFAPDPDAVKNLSIYAASSESADATLVTTLSNQGHSPFLWPVEGGSGIVFDGVNIAGWILPTADGFKAMYPQPVLGDIGWAHLLE